MDARSIIAKLRDGGVPDADELNWFAGGLADGAVSDAQAGAFAMAAVLRGLGESGRVALTCAMRDSGHDRILEQSRPVICHGFREAPRMGPCFRGSRSLSMQGHLRIPSDQSPNVYKNNPVIPY